MNDIPVFLVNKISSQYPSEKDQILKGYSANRYPAFRINRLKTTKEEIQKILKEDGVEYQTFPFLEDAFLLFNRKEDYLLAKDFYREGKIYVQSLSSQLPVFFLEPKEKESILDMAAAPGGKTTQIASLTGGKCLITACEKSRPRWEKLKYNLEKQGVKKVTVLNQDARTLDDFFSFDKILLDAPCSGSGTFHIGDTFSEELVDRLPHTQLELLRKASKIVKKGGIILYSTCSIFKEENEDIIEQILKETDLELVPISLEEVPLLPSSLEGTLVIAPTEEYEGFFLAKLRRRNS